MLRMTCDLPTPCQDAVLVHSLRDTFSALVPPQPGSSAQSMPRFTNLVCQHKRGMWTRMSIIHSLQSCTSDSRSVTSLEPASHMYIVQIHPRTLRLPVGGQGHFLDVVSSSCTHIFNDILLSILFQTLCTRHYLISHPLPHPQIYLNIDPEVPFTVMAEHNLHPGPALVPNIPIYEPTAGTQHRKEPAEQCKPTISNRCRDPS